MTQPTVEADIAILGAGIVGAACAYHLTRRGLKVALVDRAMPTAGTSGACDGYVSISSKKPGLVMAMAAESKRLYPEVVADIGRDVDYRPCGGLLIVEDPASLDELEERAAGVRSYGFDMDYLDRPGMLALEPNLAPDLHGAFRCPGEAIVSPYLMTLGQVARAVDRGAATLWEADPTGFEMAGDRIVAVDTTRGRVRAEQFVFAAGVWSAALGAMVGLDLPVIPRRGELVVTARAPGIATHYLMSANYLLAKADPDAVARSTDPLVRLGHGFCMEVNAQGQCIIGSTRAFVGFDRSTTPDGVAAIVHEAVRRLPALAGVAMLRAFGGLRPYVPDKLPIIGRSGRIANLLVATGHEGDGICLSVVTGEMIADLATGRSPRLDIAALTPDRFPPLDRQAQAVAAA
ncbi:sarcosine oxidase subunit beta [Stella humosa]|uniref:Sarcosine oxidase subunit beta n=1 Tax=Stella humosa TaxID=94 RepID=A0A3N1KXE1_9PROT|nr:FAD-binding oxidoreductase [Stella humosa]ROP83429.1 sarcosine oxidase subunit beta [Stella humosa]BBK33299.1 FAD-dependent oxidoreductase [Stella humosa]